VIFMQRNTTLTFLVIVASTITFLEVMIGNFGFSIPTIASSIVLLGATTLVGLRRMHTWPSGTRSVMRNTTFLSCTVVIGTAIVEVFGVLLIYRPHLQVHPFLGTLSLIGLSIISAVFVSLSSTDLEDRKDAIYITTGLACTSLEAVIIYLQFWYR
jgi:hypothetical protein